MKILITGFGPFRNYKENISWSAVEVYYKNHLPKNVYVSCIPVVYKEIEKMAGVFGKQSFDYALHFGRGNAKRIQFEKKAIGKGYCEPDVDEMVPPNKNCPREYTERYGESICTTFKLELLNDVVSEYNVEMSEDAGRYCCEYLYYISLCEGLKNKKTMTLFIHLPGDGSIYSTEQLGDFIKKIVDLLCKGSS